MRGFSRETLPLAACGVKSIIVNNILETHHRAWEASGDASPVFFGSGQSATRQCLARCLRVAGRKRGRRRVHQSEPPAAPKTTPTSAYRPYGDGGRQVLADKTLAGTRVYAAEVVRIIDGDTFVARMRTGTGGEVETRVRLRSIDAAELHARCSKELRLALAARAALQRLLADGRVTLSHVGPDKYP